MAINISRYWETNLFCLPIGIYTNNRIDLFFIKYIDLSCKINRNIYEKMLEL